MTNPFDKKSIPELLALVLGTARCEKLRCRDGVLLSRTGEGIFQTERWVPCPACSGTGKHPPLEDAELDALAACVCEGLWVTQVDSQWQYYNQEAGTFGWLLDTYHCYTTYPSAAMRLEEKYHIETMCIQYPDGDRWEARANYGMGTAAFGDSLCRVRTEAALLAELTMREEGANV